MNIDIHAHFIPQAFCSVARRGRSWHGARLEKDAYGNAFIVQGSTRLPVNSAWDEAPEKRVENMRALDMDLHAVSSVPFFFHYDRDVEEATGSCREINSELGEMMRSFTQHFVGLGTVPMQDGRIAARELEQAMVQDGLKGVVIATSVNGKNLDDSDLLPFFEAAEGLGAVVFVHPADVAGADRLAKYGLASWLGFPLEGAITIASLIFGGVLDRYPRLKLCFSHGGGFAWLGCGPAGSWVQYDTRGTAPQASAQ